MQASIKLKVKKIPQRMDRSHLQWWSALSFRKPSRAAARPSAAARKANTWWSWSASTTSFKASRPLTRPFRPNPPTALYPCLRRSLSLHSRCRWPRPSPSPLLRLATAATEWPHKVTSTTDTRTRGLSSDKHAMLTLSEEGMQKCSGLWERRVLFSALGPLVRLLSSWDARRGL